MKPLQGQGTSLRGSDSDRRSRGRALTRVVCGVQAGADTIGKPVGDAVNVRLVLEPADPL